MVKGRESYGTGTDLRNGTCLTVLKRYGTSMLNPGDFGPVNYFVKFANFRFLAKFFPKSQKLQITNPMEF